MTINIDIKLKRASKIYHEGVYLSIIYNNIIILSVKVMFLGNSCWFYITTN